MSKYRVYELAKDFNTTSKVIIDILARNNIVAKNHMSSLDDDAKAVIDRTFARKTGAPEETTKPEPPKTVQHVQAASGMASRTSASEGNRQGQPGGYQGQQPRQGQPGGYQGQQPRQGQPGGYQGQQPRQGQPGGYQGQQPRQGQPGGYQGQQPRQGQPGGYQGQQPRQGQPGGYQGQQPRQGQPGGYQGQQPRQGQPGGYQGQQPRQGQPGGYQGQQPRQGQPGGYQGQQPRQGHPGGYQGQQPRQGQPGGYQGQQPRQGQPGGYQGQQPRQGQPGGYQGQQPRQGQPGGYQGQQPRPAQPQQQQFRNGGGMQPQSRTGGGAAPAAQQQQKRPDGRRGDTAQGRQQFGNRQHGQFGGKKGGQPNRGFDEQARQQATKPEPIRPKVVKLGEVITVKDLAQKMSREVSEVIKKLMMLGIMATINQELDLETATIVASEFGVTVEELPPEVDPTLISEIEDEEETLVTRPPVVTIMGHVDHGKTSLLDVIRQTNVTASEAGGITQHIGAYQVSFHNKKIVFLDTPGHEAFTAMRARGAQVTDIAILVVAADDGVMPQTIEAINHAKAAKVPIIVAINKMDRPGANPDRVKQQLSEHSLIPEDWGGDTIMVPVSAHAKTGLTDLLEMVLLVAEMQDIKANPDRRAQGTIIEAELDKGRGPVATVLVQKGTLHVGDSIIAGTAFGKVRAMINDRGDKVKKALPSTPVEVLGLSDVPQAGDILHVVDERTARAVAEKRQAKKRTEELGQSQKVTLDDLFKHIQEGTIKDLNIVVKADVQGSIEALRQSLQNLKNKEVRVNIVHSGVGAINESDVMLASAANALIIGFNVRPDANARKAADNEKVDIRTYRVIYDAINDVEAAMTGMLAPEFKEVILGRVEVRQVISVPKNVVAGSYVLEGKITSSSQVRIIRNGIVIHEGKLESLRRFKDDVKEVAAGYECGITIEKFRDIKEGDILEAFVMEQIKPGS